MLRLKLKKGENSLKLASELIRALEQLTEPDN